MKTGKIILAAVIGITVLAACNKTQRSTQLSYYATQCADPWGYDTNETVQQNNVTTYLAANGVTATNVDFVLVQDSAMLCLACHCLSGMRIDINVPDEDVAEANALGFN